VGGKGVDERIGTQRPDGRRKAVFFELTASITPSLTSGASTQFPSGNRKLSNFSGYRAAFSGRNSGEFTEIMHAGKAEN
jgi:hypothetical protein